MEERFRVYVVGCGGIGGYLLNLLPQTLACLYVDWLSCANPTMTRELLEAEGIHGTANYPPEYFCTGLTLIDGDSFSGHNALRQNGTHGSKLAVQMDRIRQQDAFTTWLAGVPLKGYNAYVTPRNAGKILNLGIKSVIFLCVDNHKTRYEITKYAEQSRGRVLIINGGNKKTSGNVTVFESCDGSPLDPPIYKLYPEVTDKHDKRPDEVDCGSVSVSNDQTAVTNNMIASIMLAMFSKWVRTGNFNQKTRKKDADGKNIVVRKNEVVIDFETMTMTALSHSKELDNRTLSIVEGELPENAEII